MGINNESLIGGVPVQNAAANWTVTDVVGNKTDDENGTSLYSRAYKLEQHVHTLCRVYPTIGAGGAGWVAGAAFASAAAAGTFGVYADLVPEGTVHEGKQQREHKRMPIDDRDNAGEHEDTSQGGVFCRRSSERRCFGVLPRVLTGS